MKTLGNDKMFCLFLAGSAASFVGLAGREFARLKADRDHEYAQKKKLEASKAITSETGMPVVKKKRKKVKSIQMAKQTLLKRETDKTVG